MFHVKHAFLFLKLVSLMKNFKDEKARPFWRGAFQKQGMKRLPEAVPGLGESVD